LKFLQHIKYDTNITLLMLVAYVLSNFHYQMLYFIKGQDRMATIIAVC